MWERAGWKMKVKPLPTVVCPLYLFVRSPPFSLCQSVSNFTQDAAQMKALPYGAHRYSCIRNRAHWDGEYRFSKLCSSCFKLKDGMNCGLMSLSHLRISTFPAFKWKSSSIDYCVVFHHCVSSTPPSSACLTKPLQNQTCSTSAHGEGWLC